jgi:penicillin-binding protein 1A
MPVGTRQTVGMGHAGRRLATCVMPLVLLSATLVACGTGSRTIPSVLPSNGRRTQILASDGTLITELTGDEQRETISLDRIPVLVQNAVVAIEDERFWDHNGIDPKAVLRAARSNAEADGVTQGGSTITQQYVKTALLGPERTIQRKLEEANLALQMERSFSKRYILEQYLNTIYFGNRAYGVQMASLTYFGKPVDDPQRPITLPEAALLAAVINAPGLYDPYKKPDAARRRRNLVLAKMAELGYISSSQREEASAAPIELSPRRADLPPARYPAAHFVEEVKRFIRTDPRFGRTEAERVNLLLNGGLRIHTTIDLSMQAAAEASATEIYPNQARAITDPRKSPDVALVAIDPRTGWVKAMLGGYDYFDTDNQIHSYAQVNLATSGRQAGSTFKPIALAAALTNGIKMSDTFAAPSSTVIRIPGYPPWAVSGAGLGRATLTQCTIRSANTCFANLVADKRVLPPRVTEYAALMGIDTTRNFATVPSAVLGTNNTSVLEMTASYGTFANNGTFVPPVMVTKVVAADGSVIYQHQHTQRRVIQPEHARDITTALEGVLTSGTAAGRGIGRPAAGKTGTTQGNTDAWFIGYTPSLVTGVWTGYATPLPSGRRTIGRLRTLPGAGAQMAAPVWASFMKKVTAGTPVEDFALGSSPGPVITTTTLPKANTRIFETEKLTPTLVTMPSLVPGNTRDATTKLRRLGLRLRRVDVTSAGALPGQVLVQSPAAGAKIPSGSEVVVEATPGQPPPTEPIPNLAGQLAADVVEQLRKGGWTPTTTVTPPPPGFLLPSGLPPTSGQVWGFSPGAGTVSPDGTVLLSVTP